MPPHLISKDVCEVNFVAVGNAKEAMDTNPVALWLATLAQRQTRLADSAAIIGATIYLVRSSPLAANRPRALEYLMTQQYNFQPITHEKLNSFFLEGSSE